MTITFSWWAMPALVMLASMFCARRMLRAHIIGFSVAAGFVLLMGGPSAIFTLLVWGMTQ